MFRRLLGRRYALWCFYEQENSVQLERNAARGVVTLFQETMGTLFYL